MFGGKFVQSGATADVHNLALASARPLPKKRRDAADVPRASVDFRRGLRFEIENGRIHVGEAARQGRNGSCMGSA